MDMVPDFDQAGQGYDADGAGFDRAGQGHDGARAGFDRGGQGYDGGGLGGAQDFLMNSSDESMTSDIALSALRPAPFLELPPQTEMVRHAGGDSEDYTPLVQILDVPVPQTVEEVFEVWDRILQRTFEPQGELVPQERVQPHSFQQHTVLPLVDHILALDVVGVPVPQRPMKFCRLFVGRGCMRGYWCSFAHAAAELHPLAQNLEHWLVEDYGGQPRFE